MSYLEEESSKMDEKLPEFPAVIKALFLITLVFIFFADVNQACALQTGSRNLGKSIVDKSGNTIIVEKPFKRIISLYGTHTENLFALALDKEIIGVSKNEVYPPQTMGKKVFSYHDNAEKFIEASPDLVLIRPMIARGYKNLVLKLKRAGITVVSLQPNTIEETYSYWRNLGVLTGREELADQMIKQFKEGVLKINSYVKQIPVSKRKRVYFESIHSKMKTFSPSSIAIFALKTAGGINIAEDARAVRGTNIAAYGKERILSHADKIDVYLAQKGIMNHVSLQCIKNEGGFQSIKAVRDGRIYIIDEKIVSRATLRLLDGIYEIGRNLYPDKFNDISAFRNRSVISRAQYAEILIKMMNIPLKTPDYKHDIQKRPDAEHKYGDFKDIDYTGNDYKFIETAVYRELFDNVVKYKFYPDTPIKRRSIAYSLSVIFDLPDAGPVDVKDISRDDPLFKQIQALAGLNIMMLNKNNEFLPDKPVSGREILQIISRAKARVPSRTKNLSEF